MMFILYTCIYVYLLLFDEPAHCAYAFALWALNNTGHRHILPNLIYGYGRMEMSDSDV